MTLWHIVVLAVIQGAAELLPVSSSAHVIVASRLMGIKDISSPQYMLMLVMLHTGTMFAVIAYFWKAWKRAVFSSTVSFYAFAIRVVVATVVTGVLGLGLKYGIEKYLAHSHPGTGKAEVEELFGRLDLIAVSLAAVGILIIVSGLKSQRQRERGTITIGDSVVIGAVQGLCLPFRGFSRSGATISAGLLRGVARIRLEEFSFALAVVLTPAVIWHEARRVFVHSQTSAVAVGMRDFLPSILGMCFSFIAGLVALKILSRLLEKGQWWVFGVYCLAAAGGVYWMYTRGY
jgi:undecaprenyl-diphosphatase